MSHPTANAKEAYALLYSVVEGKATLTQVKAVTDKFKDAPRAPEQRVDPAAVAAAVDKYKYVGENTHVVVNHAPLLVGDEGFDVVHRRVGAIDGLIESLSVKPTPKELAAMIVADFGGKVTVVSDHGDEAKAANFMKGSARGGHFFPINIVGTGHKGPLEIVAVDDSTPVVWAYRGDNPAMCVFEKDAPEAGMVDDFRVNGSLDFDPETKRITGFRCAGTVHRVEITGKKGGGSKANPWKMMAQFVVDFGDKVDKDKPLGEVPEANGLIKSLKGVTKDWDPSKLIVHVVPNPPPTTDEEGAAAGAGSL